MALLRVSAFLHVSMKYRCSSLSSTTAKSRRTKGTSVFVPFLIFLWLLSFYQEKESNKLTNKLLPLNDVVYHQDGA
jgi:hypothetical protein